MTLIKYVKILLIRSLYEKSSVFAKESNQLSITAEKRENINKKTSNKGKNKDNTLEDFKNIIQTKKIKINIIITFLRQILKLIMNSWNY